MIRWECVKIEKPYRGGFEPLDHKVVIRYGGKSGSSLALSSDILKEIDADRFSLLQSGRVFALAPDSDGEIYLSRNNRLAGMGKNTVHKVLIVCGLDPNKSTQYVDAVVDGRLIAFPKKRYEKMMEGVE